ncbi:NYN domain-containing protein [uncultured Psychrobacter sp.]|uniref:NYN domain-containing protein n=1 Tax=uncultured Psychrobacter sp. TaxID=259303 RepID=UPI00262E488B|nr:NYN domain-containing protein [uncultured Psychrobacter sp.]
MNKFAVLIDADNTSHRNIEAILEEIAKYGIASVKRIYGDWSMEALHSWRDKLLPNAITPVQQFAYVTQKDATDMRLVIDAMDLLYAGDLNGFCIVSSDSDFTPLASRIRESGLLVYGFGEKKTVKSFVNACDKFIYVENLLPDSSDEGTTPNSKYKANLKPETTPLNTAQNINGSDSLSQPNKDKTLDIDPTTLNLIYKAIKDNSDDEGWASLAEIGNYINNVKPDFDTRSYGSSKLSSLLKKLVKFESKIENSHMYVRKFNFSEFIELVQDTIYEISNKSNNADDWVKLDSLVKQLTLKTKKHPILAYLSQHEIEQKILAIYSYSIEVSDDKTFIRTTS